MRIRDNLALAALALLSCSRPNSSSVPAPPLTSATSTPSTLTTATSSAAASSAPSVPAAAPPGTTWVELGRTESPSGLMVHLGTPRLPAISDDGQRLLIPMSDDTSRDLPNLRLAIVDVAGETQRASFPILTETDDILAIELAKGVERERLLEAVEVKARARIVSAERALAVTSWRTLADCSFDEPENLLPSCSMPEQHIRCGVDMVATFRRGTLDIERDGRHAKVTRRAWANVKVPDEMSGTLPSVACFWGAWFDSASGVLVGNLRHVCPAGGDGCLLRSTWHVVVAPPTAPSAAAPSATASAGGASSAAGAPACPADMMPIPEGTFSMGSANGLPNERPPHEAHVASFCMDATEVTVARYRECVSKKRCSPPAADAFCNFGEPGKNDHPINCVTLPQAESYCTFMSKRLPTESEWEFAARGPGGRLYPSGDAEPGSDVCWRRAWNAGTCPAGASPRDLSPFGLLDMTGNVSEWTSSRSTLDYKMTSPLALYSFRGGYWSATVPGEIRATRRHHSGSKTSGDALGFRCARAR